MPHCKSLADPWEGHSKVLPTHLQRPNQSAGVFVCNTVPLFIYCLFIYCQLKGRKEKTICLLIHFLNAHMSGTQSGFPHGWQGLKHLDIIHSLPVCIIRNWVRSWRAEMQSGSPIWDVVNPSNSLTCMPDLDSSTINVSILPIGKTSSTLSERLTGIR